MDEAGIDTILVGDSLGMVVLGYPDTVSVTLDEMIHHVKAVSRTAKRSLVVGDMPFLSYQVSISEAVRNAGRFLKEAGMDAIKLEGGRRVIDQIRGIVDAGILVIGHIGLTPQSSGQLGGFKAQGRTAESAEDLIKDALEIQEAGAFALLLAATGYSPAAEEPTSAPPAERTTHRQPAYSPSPQPYSSSYAGPPPSSSASSYSAPPSTTSEDGIQDDCTYKGAKLAGGFAWTDAYVFYTDKAPGITAAMPVIEPVRAINWVFCRARVKPAKAPVNSTRAPST